MRNGIRAVSGRTLYAVVVREKFRKDFYSPDISTIHVKCPNKSGRLARAVVMRYYLIR